MKLKKYRICDLGKGLFAEDRIIEAKSPIDALKTLGYTDIVRDIFGKGNIVVYGSHGSYVYEAKGE